MILSHRAVLAVAVAALTLPVLAGDYAALPPAEAAQAVAQGASVIHDYGSFAWVRGRGQGAADLGRRRPGGRVHC